MSARYCLLVFVGFGVLFGLHETTSDQRKTVSSKTAAKNGDSGLDSTTENFPAPTPPDSPPQRYTLSFPPTPPSSSSRPDENSVAGAGPVHRGGDGGGSEINGDVEEGQCSADNQVYLQNLRRHIHII